MRSHRRSGGWVRGAGFLLTLALAVFACSGEQYEKPEEAAEPAAEAPPEAPPPAAPEPETAPAPEPPAEPEPAADSGAAEEAEPPAAVEEPVAAPAAAAPAAEPEPTAEPAPEPTPEPEPAAAAPADLVLVGVVQAGKSPAALIEYRGAQEMFRTGDSVFGQGTVESVRGDSVVLATESGKVTLGLPAAEEELPPPTPEPAVVAAAPPAGEAPPPPVRQSVSKSEAERALSRFAAVLREAGAETAEVAGGKGILLNDVASGSFLAHLGLKSGDVLQKIGGIAVEDPEALPDVSAAARGGEITVNVVRGEIGLTFSRPLR